MLKHYLTVAFRNMWKYKSQTLISVIGLAVGFTCFALASLWIRYEMTYDGFHRDAGQIYNVYKPDVFAPSGISRSNNYKLPAFLKETFPEVSDAAAVIPPYPGTKFKIDGREYPAYHIDIDSAFFHMFDIRIIEGSRDFLIPRNDKVAITQQKAREWFGNEDPTGKELEYYGTKKTICAVVAGWNHPSNYRFDLIESMRGGYDWNGSSGEHALIKLAPGTDEEAFRKKLSEFEYKNEGQGIFISKLTISPLTQVRYKDPDVRREVKFQYIVYFAVAGLLVILCSLFNYLMLFVSRFRIRRKELALRMICGASGGSLFLLLSVEFLLTLAFAFLLGLCCEKLTLPEFEKLAEIQAGTSAVYGELSLYVLGVILVSLLFFLLILLVFRKRTLNTAIRKRQSSFFRYASIVSQLVISIGFIFCTAVMLKQIYFLHHTTDIGFNYRNMSYINLGLSDSQALAGQLREIPEITDILTDIEMPLFPIFGRSSYRMNDWEGKPSDAESIDIETMSSFSKRFVEFYGVQLLSGEWLEDNDSTQVLINESAVKAFGWDDPVGKTFGNGNHYKVKGVIKNIYNISPTVVPNPMYYTVPSEFKFGQNASFPVKYKEGTWKTCKAKIESLFEKEYKEVSFKQIIQGEEKFNEMFKSEDALLKLLGSLSAVCIIICLFGFVSIVALSCEERRKEIAIRKINGATIRNILDIFFREYFTLLLIGSVIAFSAGYYIMKRWIEQYVLQTTVPAWIYLSIVLAMALVIVLCVGWRVYRASVENPAEVVKSE